MLISTRKQLADHLAEIGSAEIRALQADGLDRQNAEKLRQAQVALADPAGTIRYLDNGPGHESMFLVRHVEDPEDYIDPSEAKSWQPYIRDDHGIDLYDGDFDASQAPVVGSMPNESERLRHA